MKIGILTHYYESRNYGGLLQAYALVTYLRSQGYDAEQICYKRSSVQYAKLINININEPEESAKIVEKEIDLIQPLVDESEHKKIIENDSFVEKAAKSLYYRLFIKPKEIRKYKKKKKEHQLLINNIEEREQIVSQFRISIPHSIRNYNKDNIVESNSIYDCFITGSDQVWNFNWFNSAFFLEFTDEKKKKIAYSASAGKSEFEEYEKVYLNRMLPRFDSISVREADLTDQFSKISGKEVKNTLDPVFLLDKNEWDMISNERIIKGKYIFVYLLGPTDEQAKVCKELSKKLHAKIVYIPHAAGNFYLKEPEIKGKILNKIGPKEFISLIKNATYVLTDSFHATAFSIIFKKSFYSFPRNGMEASNSRVQTLVSMIGCRERFENGVLTIGEIVKLLMMKKYYSDILLSKIDDSKCFLKEALQND